MIVSLGWDNTKGAGGDLVSRVHALQARCLIVSMSTWVCSSEPTKKVSHGTYNPKNVEAETNRSLCLTEQWAQPTWSMRDPVSKTQYKWCLWNKTQSWPLAPCAWPHTCMLTHLHICLPAHTWMRTHAKMSQKQFVFLQNCTLNFDLF